jgi:hypothetical protein
MSEQPGPALQPNNWFANMIGVGVAAFLCFSTWYLMWKVLNSKEADLTDKVINIAIYILGFLTAKISTIVDWCFGGSSATKRQGEIIATQASTAATLAAQHAGTTTTTTTVVPQSNRTSPTPISTPAASGDVQVEIPPGATANVHAAGAPVKPDEVSQTDWDAMTDVDKAAVVLRYAK